MKKPYVGELWKSKSSDYHVLITDVTKKKKGDIRHYDDDWNDAKTGQVFVYSYSEVGSATYCSRGRLEHLINDFRYLKRVPKCPCLDCKKHHVNWAINVKPNNKN